MRVVDVVRLPVPQCIHVVSQQDDEVGSTVRKRSDGLEVQVQSEWVCKGHAQSSSSWNLGKDGIDQVVGVTVNNRARPIWAVSAQSVSERSDVVGIRIAKM